MENVTLILGKQYVPAIEKIFATANTSLCIVVFDFRIYPDQVGSQPFRLLEAIKSASRRGVDVRILTMRLESVQELKNLGLKIKHWQGGKTLHAKFFVVDSKVAVLGSHNYTMNALTLNHEASVLIQSESFAAEMQKYFEDLWTF